MEKGLEKESILDEKDAVLVNKFYLKLRRIKQYKINLYV